MSTPDLPSLPPAHDGADNVRAHELRSGDGLEVLYFGCIGDVGHYLHSKRNPRIRWTETAWGDKIDTGVFPKPSTTGVLYTDRRGGWTAIAVWDNSVDRRPGSHSTFVVAADVNTEELLRLAKEQWPEVFSRRGFPTFSNKAVNPTCAE